MAADLHCHTKLSDGSVGIEDLIAIASRSGIDTIAITDHDCLAGSVRGQVIGKRYGVTVIPAVELSAFDEQVGKMVHIISYLADSPARLEHICKQTSGARKRAAQIMMLKVAARFPISTEFILNHASGSTNLYKQHIVHALMDAGYTDKIYGDLYNALFDAGSETNVLAPTRTPSVKTVIDEIHEAGGVAILAHPGKYNNIDELDEYVELGLDGIEVWSPFNDDELTQKLVEYCNDKKILLTGGSNFHGIYGEKAVTIGSYCTPQENLDKLMGYKTKKKRMAKRAEKEAQKDEE